MLSLKLEAGDNSVLAEAIAAYEKEDFAEAFALFSDLAEQGNADAKAWLAAMYVNGEGVSASLAKAVELYRESAEAGNVLAQTNLGAMLAMGQGVDRDEAEGVRWLTKAAEQGDLFAQYNLATLYSKGQGIPLDSALAAKWYRVAAEAGHYPSQARLGFFYANGIGVAKDRVEAFVWLSLAAQHGVGTALNALEGLVAQMSTEEKQKGAALVEAWRSRDAGGVSACTSAAEAGMIGDDLQSAADQVRISELH